MSRPGTPSGPLSDGWHQHWLRGEQPGRGVLRSYTVRALRTTDQGRELDVDFVLHPAETGRSAPGSDWARTATPGTPALIIGPDCRIISTATPWNATGIRWAPQGSRNVLLAGDETAVPAISAILEALPAGVGGSAYLEVPDAGDVQDIRTRSNVRVTWLPRNAARGELLVGAIEQHCGGPSDRRLNYRRAAFGCTSKIWDRTSLREQENLIGRTKSEGAQLSGGTEFTDPDFAASGRASEPLIGTDARVRIAHPAHNHGVHMLRRGYNYRDGSDGVGHLDAGLFFIAFVKDPRTH
ncbi:hypothetical protein ABIB51_003250 [Arthrobacter sp. UYCu712]